MESFEEFRVFTKIIGNPLKTYFLRVPDFKKLNISGLLVGSLFFNPFPQIFGPWSVYKPSDIPELKYSKNLAKTNGGIRSILRN